MVKRHRLLAEEVLRFVVMTDAQLARDVQAVELLLVVLRPRHEEMPEVGVDAVEAIAEQVREMPRRRPIVFSDQMIARATPAIQAGGGRLRSLATRYRAT